MLELNKENFELEVLKAQGLVLVDFWSPKCEPCMDLLPSIENLSQHYPEVKFTKLNIAENRRLAISQRVMGLPTILIYQDGVKMAELSKDFEIEDVEEKLKELS